VLGKAPERLSASSKGGAETLAHGPSKAKLQPDHHASDIDRSRARKNDPLGRLPGARHIRVMFGHQSSG
jgi:hypothetical protein